MQPMQPLDDITPEELDQQNAAIITFLHHINGQSEADFVTVTIEAQATEQARVIANVRQRLLTLEPEQAPVPQLYLVAQETSAGSINSTTMSTPDKPLFRKRRSWQQRIGLFIAVALLLLLVGSSAFMFKYMQQSKTGQSLTPATTTGVSATHTIVPLSPQQEARKLVQHLHNEATVWGNAHPYHDAYDGHSYALDAAYLQVGLGRLLDDKLAQARTTADYEAVIHAANDALFNLHTLEADFNDITPFNAVHQADIEVMQHYHLQGQVIVVSLVEQTMRIYQDGQLVHAYYVTTGRPELPSTPGIWHELYRASPTTLKSAYAPDSPFWFPDTQVNYSMLYQTGEHLIVDSHWRGSYGPGTQFPHRDVNNNTFANNGTEGGIDMLEQDAAWVYNHTSLNTHVVIY